MCLIIIAILQELAHYVQGCCMQVNVTMAESSNLYSKGIHEWLQMPEKEDTNRRTGLADKLGMWGANQIANDVTTKVPEKEAEGEVESLIQLQQRTNKALWQRMVGLESTPFKCAPGLNKTSNHSP